MRAGNGLRGWQMHIPENFLLGRPYLYKLKRREKRLRQLWM